MSRRTLHLVVAATLLAPALALPLAAHADTRSYSYVDVAHFPKVDLDDGTDDVDGDGLQLRGSITVLNNFFAYTEFQSLDFERGVDVTRVMIGAGGHWPINNMIDVVARVGVVNYKVDLGSIDDDDTGIFIGGRIRATVIPKLEVEGGVEHQHVSVYTLENDTYLVGEARYNFTPQWSAGVIVNVGGDTNLVGAQGRFSF